MHRDRAQVRIEQHSSECYVAAGWMAHGGFGLRVFKTKPFARFANREGIPDAVLCDAAQRVGRGQMDADLGGGVIKQRIARRGQGRSGGYRTIVLFRRGERSFFVYGCEERPP